jgi:hypothetical protein
MAVEGDAVPDPGYTKSQSIPQDIAVVDFAQRAVTPADVWTFTPAQLPTADELDALGRRTPGGATLARRRLRHAGGSARPGWADLPRRRCAHEGTD